MSEYQTVDASRAVVLYEGEGSDGAKHGEYVFDLSDIEKRREKVWELRINGMPVRKIAKILNMPWRTVYHDLSTKTRQVDTAKLLETELDLDIDRLNGLLRIYYPLATGRRKGRKMMDPTQIPPPDKDAAKLVLQILKQRADLLGLNAPKRVDITALIVEWATSKGLDISDTFDAIKDLFPSPAA